MEKKRELERLLGVLFGVPSVALQETEEAIYPKEVLVYFDKNESGLIATSRPDLGRGFPYKVVRDEQQQIYLLRPCGLPSKVIL